MFLPRFILSKQNIYIHTYYGRKKIRLAISVVAHPFQPYVNIYDKLNNFKHTLKVLDFGTGQHLRHMTLKEKSKFSGVCSRARALKALIQITNNKNQERICVYAYKESQEYLYIVHTHTHI